MKLCHVSATLFSVKMIKPIERCLVEKIASGQVVNDLSSALKELVENSIDANATLIGSSIDESKSIIKSSLEVNLFNDGIDAFEVIDNGSGIPLDSLESLGTIR